MILNADYLVGRRFEYFDGSGPDITFVAADPQKGTVRAHAEGGGAETLELAIVLKAVAAGALVESEYGCPFVNEPEPKRTGVKTGIAGTGKRILRLIAGGKWAAF